MKGLKLSGSVYRNGGSDLNGLTVRNGRLMNDRPCGNMGIVDAANARKEMRRQEKIDMIAEGYARGEMRAEMSEMIGGIMGKMKY